MVKASWGTKRTCQSCAARFYDLNKGPIKCPKCGREHDREDFVKVRRGRGATAAAARGSGDCSGSGRQVGGQEEERRGGAGGRRGARCRGRRGVGGCRRSRRRRRGPGGRGRSRGRQGRGRPLVPPTLLRSYGGQGPAKLRRSEAGLLPVREAGIIPRAARHDPGQRFRGHSSAGRALQWHCRGRRFDPVWLHQSNQGVSPQGRPLAHFGPAVRSHDGHLPSRRFQAWLRQRGEQEPIRSPDRCSSSRRQNDRVTGTSRLGGIDRCRGSF